MACKSNTHVAYAFQRMCQAFNTPRSLAAYLLYTSGEHLQLARLEISANDYLDTDYDRFRNDYLITEYLSKFEGLDTGVDRSAVALQTWRQMEEKCGATNLRIRTLYDRDDIPATTLDILLRAQQKIESCIGARVKWSAMLNRFRWGPGSTATLHSAAAGLDHKLCEEQISVTHEALPLLRAAMATDYAWLRARGLDPSGPTSLVNSEFRVVEGSRGVTVPKNAKTDRFIAAEPSGNVFLQLGFGAYFRQCLTRVGVDLNDQTVNQGLARDGLDLGLATVDLKSASDTITTAVVWLLLPYSWASALSRLRSPVMTLPDNTRTYLEKFSSMGNGFTFELESLIFWALTEAVRDRMGIAGRVSVYGDDIICPSECVPMLREILEWCGFELNSKKTHCTSVFRESCGKHYFGGKDVTPIYQKKPTDTEEEFYRFHNRLLYHAIDRVGCTDPHLFADDAFRWVGDLARSYGGGGKRRGFTIPLVSVDRRLDGGLCTDVRSLNHRVSGGFRRVSTLARVFKPHERAVDHGVAFAFLHRFKPVVAEAFWWPGVIQEPLPFKGTVTERLQGRWVVRRTYFPEARELRWIKL